DRVGASARFWPPGADDVPAPAVERTVLSQARFPAGAARGDGAGARGPLRRGGAGGHRSGQAHRHVARTAAAPGRGAARVSERLCAFLAMQDSSGWSIDVELGIPPLAALGWRVELVPWRSSAVDWNRFDLVYLGTPWDYPEDPEH